MDRLHADQRLGTGEELTSGNGRVRLVMQGDGNLVLYRTDDGAPLWATDTWQQPATHAVMQGDGNFVLYTDEEKPLWASGTDGNPGAWLVLQDDGNLVVYAASGAALWASGTVQRFGPVTVPGFRPSTRAPLFGNSPWPPGTHLQISLSGLPPVSLDATEMGLCGGMSFLARDIHESGTPQLRGRSSAHIPLDLAHHILRRLVDSFGGPGVVGRWLGETQALDHETVFWGPGLFHRTIDEIPGILDEIDRGVLCPIGLVLVHSYAPWDVFQNHVVLVWGYERHGDILTLRTYDCNAPGRDDIVIRLDVSSHRPAKTISTNGTDGAPGRIRGFFRLPYTHVDPAPAYIDGAFVRMTGPPPTPMAAGTRAQVTVTAVNNGSTTWTAADVYRLGSQSPQDNTTWGTGRVDLPQATVDPGDSAVFRFGIQAPATAGRYAFCWQMVREGVRWFGQPSPRVTVAVGSTSGVCDQLRAQYQDLARQLDDVRGELEGIDWSDPYEARREATRLNRQAKALREQLDVVERDQRTHGCAPN
ncbi:NBR1-Ig-like domain-containing protein [Streptomyces sp. GXMU-J15]|uniref:NBR1-Ig-like domain-containing protein n=1 Tax=Streptomyces fuscus TaxID=3048495 RepID=A0ABT7J2B4_9ACTN|nr:NBR1-Ig-like domain-containing protein [Streptomyces fuscus]MDL2079000.1 NBR1-Ig-like domain-containing protein [Streptomyces fuscus]